VVAMVRPKQHSLRSRTSEELLARELDLQSNFLLNFTGCRNKNRRRNARSLSSTKATDQ
jgi:hypothetical protein